MSKVAVIHFGSGNLLSGFPNVTAQLLGPDNPRPIKFTAALPPAAELDAIYRRWHLIYQALYQTPGWHPRIKIEREDVTNVSLVELAYICTQYRLLLNEWLDGEQFRNIDRQLRSHLLPAEEIQLILETDDDMVRRLPWHLWDFLSDYPKAEMALSAPQYQRGEKFHNREQIRILAILGNSSGIDIAADRQILASIPDAETVFLVEPSRLEVDEQLWDDQGWDILFFAGHSESQENGHRGLLAINTTDKIGISHLKAGLKNAIYRGLQLAIFNSCDGLGLATELADLHIPQIIVMREPVADGVANAFLVKFVKAFSSGYSFYLAVRQARERLQGLEDKFPCASWLPVICQNPAEVPMQWRIRSAQAPLISPIPETPPRSLVRTGSVWLNTVAVTLMILIIRQLGLLQGWELKAYDYLMRSRPPEAPDPRILVVEVTENDVQLQPQYPLSDATLTQLLQNLAQHQPRAIGLTIYRDKPVPPGHQELIAQMQKQSNVFAVCSFPRGNEPALLSPAAMPKKRLGFDDINVDMDGLVRRQLLFMKADPKCNTGTSLSFQLATKYLEYENIVPTIENISKNVLKIGKATFNKIKPNTGGYKTLGKGGWYVMLNYRSFPVAKSLTLTEVLAGDFNPNLVKDRIVIIGVTSRNSGGKYFLTPYSITQSPGEEVAAVMIQAQMVSDILSAALDGRPLIGVWEWWGEVIWIALWSIVGSAIGWRVRGKVWTGGAIVCAIFSLYAICYLLLTQGTWVPLIPAALSLVIGPWFFVPSPWSPHPQPLSQKGREDPERRRTNDKGQMTKDK